MDSGKTFPVTDTWYNSGGPSFSTDGKYLFFISDRDFNPVYSATEWNHAYLAMSRVYFVTLAKDTKSPFEPKSDEVALKPAPEAKTTPPAKPAPPEKKPAGKAEPEAAPPRGGSTGPMAEYTLIDPPQMAAALVAHSLVFDFVCDDAYISFVYSRNLAEHGQLVFNLGDYAQAWLASPTTALPARPDPYSAAGKSLGPAPGQPVLPPGRILRR